MSDSLDRRTLLKGAAVAAVAIGSIGEGEAAFPDGLGYGEPAAFSYDLLKAQRAGEGSRALRRSAASGARSRAEDQL